MSKNKHKSSDSILKEITEYLNISSNGQWKIYTAKNLSLKPENSKNEPVKIEAFIGSSQENN